jgi:hypothetical protein
MFTEEQRQAIRIAMAQSQADESDDYKVMVVNPPSDKDPIDHTNAIGSVAEAVKSISGEQIAMAIMEAVEKSNAATAKSISSVGRLVVAAIEAMPKPEKPEKEEKLDLSPITTAIDRNTAALERLAKVMATPKTLIFDEMDPTKPVGVKMQRAN